MWKLEVCLTRFAVDTAVNAGKLKNLVTQPSIHPMQWLNRMSKKIKINMNAVPT